MLQGTRQVKKLIVKNFKGSSLPNIHDWLGQRIPDNFETSSWDALRSGLQAIFSGRHDSISLEILYRVIRELISAFNRSQTCEDICRCRMAHPLYSKLYSECELHTQSFGPRVLQLISSSLTGDELLQAIKNLWTEFTEQIKIVCDVFLFLDRVFVLNRPELSSVWDFCMILFRMNAFYDSSVRLRIIEALLKSIENDRNADISKASILISDIISMLTDLKLMDEWAKKDIMEDTVRFFETESRNQLQFLNLPRYLEYARRRIDAEILRFETHRFDVAFRADLLQHVQRAVFVIHLDEILGRGFEGLIDDEDNENLKLLFDLCQETLCIDRLKDFWSKLIKKIGSQLVGESGKEEIIVRDLIAFKDKLDRIVKVAFADNVLFSEAEKESFESFMNGRHNRPAELIAKYADYQLRGGAAESLTNSQVEPILDKIITLFRFIQGKDYFESIFKKDLSRRLLFYRSISIDVEKSFVNRLKQECGSAFTSRLEGMFKDIELSRETFSVYQAQKQKVGDGRDFTATIIASGLWPYPPLILANVPTSIIREQDEFETFYKAQHKSRMLNWHQGLGSCILKANFSFGSKELQLSIPQALILLCFNDSVEKSYGDLRRSTGLDDISLVRTLQSLAGAKVNILLKEPKGREISINDKFVFNNEFTSKYNRIRINALSDREVGEEQVISPTEGPSDRLYQIDAAIVRLLKTHQRLEKEELVNLVSEQLKVNLTDDEFMKRIQSLIDREFIGHNPDEPLIYVYVA